MPVLSKRQQLPIELPVYSSAEHPPPPMQSHPQLPECTNVYPKQLPPGYATQFTSPVYELVTTPSSRP